jgi:hypothetical protein
MGVDIGTGATITFGTSSWAASIVSMNHSGMDRPSIPTSHLGTTVWNTFVAGDLTDPGELEIEYQADTSSVASTGTKYPPIAKVAETVTVTLPTTATSGNATFAGSGFVTSCSPFTIPLEELMVGSCTVKFAGAITRTDA